MGYRVGNRTAVIAVLWALLALPLFAAAQDRLVRFDGGIGVVPARFAAGAAAPTTVRGVPPGGQPWVISRLTVDVRTDGRISVDGRGLLLAGGDAIAGPGEPPQVVHATLFCGPGNGTPFDSPAVTLAPDGDFHIDGELVGLPQACERPVLLIRNAGGAWFAAGIPKL
jgi:hypothetical protein